MKVKLLKLVRKRFEILHKPNGFVMDGSHFDYNLFELIDKKSRYSYIHPSYFAQLGKKEKNFCSKESVFETREECISHLKGVIIRKLRSEGHKRRKEEIINSKFTKIWHI